MGYKNIYKQMFDVLPLNGSGELDLEKIESVKEILNLVLEKRNHQAIVLAKKKEIIENKKVDEIIETSAEIASLFENYWHTEKSEPLDSFTPTKEEIMATLDEIEKRNDFLEKYDFEEWDKCEKCFKKQDVDFEPALIEEATSEIKQEIQEIVLSENKNIFVQDDFESKVEDYFLKKERSGDKSVFVNKPIFSSLKFWKKKKTEKSDDSDLDCKIDSGFFNRTFVYRGAGFLSAGFLIFLVIFGLSLAGRGILAKENILGSALQAYKSMLAAKDSASHLDFSSAQVNFETAYNNFNQADDELNKMGHILISVLEKLPGGSQVSSGSSLVSAGENLANAGQSFSRIANVFFANKISDYFGQNGEPLTQKIVQIKGDIKLAQKELEEVNKNLAKVKISDLPPDMISSIDSLKNKLPPVALALGQFDQWSDIFLELLGHSKAKKYLLVFQNNSELRPTGGFIGTYGVLDLDEGKVNNLFIDGIFNLDGQLYEKVAPPKPIQKISTAWSAHDANWFPDFPTSAKKIMGFYEKAGGETVDGVISMTPTVVERLLEFTGPIDLPEYGASLNKDNFMDVAQYKIEVDYDKQLNQPKKILADFAPKFMERLWQIMPKNSKAVLEILSQSLIEKHILFYFTDSALEKTFVNEGFGGEIAVNDKDYLAVINTNINGFKTDRMIEQKIQHQAEIQEDGSIVDKVKITRIHHGGKEQYDWYNKVNADYMRVYAPYGSKLLSAKGQTLEAYNAPINYSEQKFKEDLDVVAEENSETVDSKSGTHIFQESGKTVFGNWVYVSPGETVEIEYEYLLPFRLDLRQNSQSYSLLAQKQAGTISSQFESILKLSENYRIDWQYPQNLQIKGEEIKFESDLKKDDFYGVVFGD